MSLFSRAPGWLRNALLMSDPNVPNRLAADEVVPIIDVLRSGWNEQDPFTITHPIPGGSAASSWRMNSAGSYTPGASIVTTDAFQCLLWLYCNQTAGVNVGVTTFMSVNGGATPPVAIGGATVGAGSSAGHSALWGTMGQRPIFIPPGGSIQLNIGATDPASTFNIVAHGLRFPASAVLGHY